MKKWVSNNFYLPAMIDKGLDAKDYFLLDWLRALWKSGKMVKKSIFFKNRNQYLDAYYVKYDGLIKDLGSFLDISCNEVIGRRLTKYEEKGLIYKTLLQRAGTYVFIHFIEKEWNKICPGKSMVHNTQKLSRKDDKVDSGIDLKVDTNNTPAKYSEATTTVNMIKDVFGDLANEFDKGFPKNLEKFLSDNFTEDEESMKHEYVQFVKDYSIGSVKDKEKLTGYVFKSIFKDSLVFKFRKREKNNVIDSKEGKTDCNSIVCVACGKEHNDPKKCPRCWLSREDFIDEEKILFHQKFSKFSNEIKEQYNDEYNELMNELWKKGLHTMPVEEVKRLRNKFYLE